jgi:hypothetical protein
MKLNRTIIVFLAACFMHLSLSPLAAQEKMVEPAEFFPGFPEIKWGSSIADAKKAIEKAGFQVTRTLPTETVWQPTLEGELARGAAMILNDRGVDEIIVIVYHSEKGKEIHEKWLRKLIEKQGEPHESLAEEVASSKIWRFKNNFAVELRLVGGYGDKMYLVDLHWVKLAEPAQ